MVFVFFVNVRINRGNETHESVDKNEKKYVFIMIVGCKWVRTNKQMNKPEI